MIRMIPCNIKMAAVYDTPFGTCEKPVMAFCWFDDFSMVAPMVFDEERGITLADAGPYKLLRYVLKE